ncbi:hypothetical protein A0H81_02860 [Grifola frondosa]|uniref:Uncharacterized protein n=1 Tax=Grifola frondosa TaxID=5627 RepID=A0A1C7MN77_GRIFR|nr:hypothetical protein A0H81_02860 [Grifola frondosa]
MDLKDRFCASIGDGDTEVTTDDYPSFLYNQDEYNPEAIDKGFLHGTLLVMCFKSLFLGPQNVKKHAGEKENGPSKLPLAQKYNITSVTSWLIAYVAVLVHFILNSQAQWAQINSNFNPVTSSIFLWVSLTGLSVAAAKSGLNSI